MRTPKRKPVRPRNPFALALITDPAFRTKIAKSTAEREEQRGGWSRKAKHKKVLISVDGDQPSDDS